MKNSYNDAAFFLLLHITIILFMVGSQFLGMHWSFAESNAFGILLAHPGLAMLHLSFSLCLLFLFWLKNEKTHKLMFCIALIGCIYGAYLIIFHAIGLDFLLIFGASRIMRFSAPVALRGGTGIFAKPIHRAEDHAQKEN